MPGRDLVEGHRFVRRLASGGMADVFLARSGDRLVAVKLPGVDHVGDEEAWRMLRDEAEVASRLCHPCIVSVVRTGDTGGIPWIAMEYVDGPSLAAALVSLRRLGRTMPVDVAVHVARSVAAGLDHAHRLGDADGNSLGVVHRDVSPANILLDRCGRVKLCDFGIARTSLRSRHTTQGVLRGKLPYMAPEQANLDRVGPATDQFALGAVLFEMLTGQPLYDGADDLALLERVRAGDIPSLEPAGAKLPGIERILARMLARSPDDRYPDLASTAVELDQLVTGTAPETALARLVDEIDGDHTLPLPLLSTPTRRLAATATTTAASPITPRRWHAVAPLAALAVAVLFAAVPNAPATTSAANATIAPAPGVPELIVEPWDVTGAAADPLRTMGPAMLGERLLSLRRVRPVFAFRFAEEGLAEPATDGRPLRLRGRAWTATSGIAGVIELYAPDGQVTAAWPLDGEADTIPQRIAEVARAVATRLGDHVTDGRPPLPLVAERLRRTAIRNQGRAGAAIGMFRELAVRYPKDPASYLWAGAMAWWHGGDGLPSIDDLEQLARDQDAPPLVREALPIMRGFLVDGHLAWRARAEALAARFPDEPFAWLLAGEALLHSGRVREATDLLARVTRAEPLFARNNWRRFELARTQGDAATLTELVDLARRTDPITDIGPWEMRRHAALRQLGEAVVIGRDLIEHRRSDPDAVAETALGLAALGRDDEAAALIDARIVWATGARPVHLAALALCRAADDAGRCLQWTRRATPGGLGGPMQSLDSDLRFAASVRLLDALTGDVGAWESDVARLRARATTLQGRDRRLLAMSDAVVAFHRRDPAALDALAGGDHADAARFAAALARELRGDLEGALADHAAAFAARPDGTFAAIVGHASARVAHALGRFAEVRRGCDEVLAPRVLAPYFAVLTADCRGWSLEAPAFPVQRSGW